MADNPQAESVSKPTTTIQETQQAFANLINTARSEQPTPEVKETEQVNLEADNELSVDDISEEDLVDNEETTTENNQELFDITINGKTQKVNLDELKEGYSKGSDYTRKTMELSEQRRSIDTELDTISKDKEAVKKMRDDYAQKLQVVEQNLQTEDNIDWVALAQSDPTDYAIKKAEYDRKKELQSQVQQERQKLAEQQRKEQEQIYQNHIQNERGKLIEMMPIFGDEQKAPKIMKDIGEFAMKQGYTEQEVNMVVDHRAVKTLHDAMKYNQLLERKNLKDKKVKPANRVVSSEGKNETKSTDKQLRVNDRMKQLKKSGNVKDAQKVLSAMLSNN
nr:nonstructural protein NSP1-like [uncultured Mediterranean phage uvMED]BAR17980.1 nonstructural protein NSP1-like [uncultured Mediterranean phage uvMED]